MRLTLSTISPLPLRPLLSVHGQPRQTRTKSNVNRRRVNPVTQKWKLRPCEIAGKMIAKYEPPMRLSAGG
jgi:hypothetical protein